MPGLNVGRVPKIWGREIILHNEGYCAKILQYDGIRTSSKHYHEKKHETLTVVKGFFEVEWYHLDDTSNFGEQRMGVGACLVLAPRTVHKFKCISPEGGWLLEASSQDDPDDCVRIEPSVNPFGK